MTRKYGWRDGFHARIAADVAAVELERVRERHDGELDADAIVTAARPVKSKLHPAFEWDDPTAAHEHRKQQARQMTASLIEYEVVDGRSEPMEHRVYDYVTRRDNGDSRRYYAPTTSLLADQDTREQILNRARREADSYRRRYAALEELADVFAAMESTFETEE